MRRPVYWLALIALLSGTSCQTGKPAKSEATMLRELESWKSEVHNFETELEHAAQTHAQFMRVYEDTLPALARQNFLNDSLYRTEVLQLDADFERWASQQVVHTRRLRIFLNQSAQLIAEFGPKTERNWQSQFGNFARLKQAYTETQLQYSALVRRYANVGNESGLSERDS